MAKCASCGARKGKRNCPAFGSVICSQCCGTKREKEIECSDDCFYLGKSRQYFTDRQDAKKISDFEREMKSLIQNEDQYLDILQNIEFTLYQLYQKYETITDKDVETALDYILEMGKAQMNAPAKFLTELPFKIQAIVDAVDDVFAQRESFTGAEEKLIVKLKCIYRVLDSVRTHYSPNDDCSYLKFIGHFLT